MENNKSGFAFIPILIGLCMLIAGVGVGVVITQKSYSVPLESNVVNAVTQDIPKVELDDTLEVSGFVDIKERKDVTVPEIVSDAEIENINIPEVSIDNQLKGISDNIPKIESFLQKEKGNALTQEEVKQQSESLTVIMNDAKRIADNKKDVMKREIESCKKYYDYEVESIESTWKSDLNYYEQQKSWYSSNSGLYQLTGNSNSNYQYLEEDLNQSRDRREDALESAESRYESCKDNYEWDTSIDKDISKIIAEQKNVISNLTDDNTDYSLNSISKLIQEAETLKYSLMFLF